MTDRRDKWDQLLVTGGALLDGATEAEEDWTGQTLGAFELTERIDVGGMSSVYRGRRTDQFEQTVAVKVMAAALQGDAHHNRFVRERQILADLDHPGIARIIDGGVSADRPYLVMELVAGSAIDEYCDLHQPAFSARLNLLAKVAAAVEHAHRNGVVHLDLKPGNVLVNDRAEPKLLDFGISSLAGEDDESIGLMTPLYAAPEQFEGAATSELTDVFQLGLLIGRLVTGQHPLVEQRHGRLDQVRNQMTRSALRVELLEQVPAGSRADLKYLLQRCLKIEPGERYESVVHLRQDLQALASSEALPSRLLDTGYRLKKAAGRRRPELLAAVGVIAVATVTGGLVWRQIERQQAQVTASSESATAMGEVVSDILEKMDPLENTGAAPISDVISVANFEKLTTATRSNPEVQRDMVIQSGRTLLDASQFGDVVDLVQPLVTELEAVSPPPPRFAEFLSLLGYARYRNGNLAEGIQELRRALALQDASPETSPMELSLTLQRLAMAERRGANRDAASQYIQRALSLLPDNAEALRQRAQAHSQHGLILTDLGKLDEALAAFSRSLELLQQAPGNNAVRRAMTLSNMADALRLGGQLDQAETNARDAVALLGAGQYKPQLLATANTTLGNVLMAQQAYSDAGGYYRTALDAYRSDLGETHPRVALVAHNLATATRLGGDCAGAIEYYDLAIAIASGHYPPNHPELVESRRQRGLCSP